MNKLNNKKGISLIVLVITIAVMIILAAAIILSLQSSGIIGRANEAKTASDVANAKQVVAMAEAEWQLDEEKIRTENNVTTFKEYANKKLTEAGFTTEGNGGISLSESGAVNTIYVDSKGKQAIIPEGFTVSSVSTEKTIEDGLVIIDEKGNEFVWVPVAVPDGKTFEEVFIRTTASDSNYTEPYSTTGYTEEVVEYNKMKASVEKNGGFYIGRYEAGTTIERKVNVSNKTSEVVVQKNKPVYNYVAWGASMTDVTGDVTYDSMNHGKGAVELSRDMYKSSNSVVSTLCYGVQWDAVMNFMKDVPNPNVPGKKYIEDSTGMGWYSDNYSEGNPSKITGVDVDENASNMVKNIYDMAGNVFEWTMEVNYTDCRVSRGGHFAFDGAYLPASYRSVDDPVESIGVVVGFRPALYIK